MVKNLHINIKKFGGTMSNYECKQCEYIYDLTYL
jgi:hypothetical protein